MRKLLILAALAAVLAPVAAYADSGGAAAACRAEQANPGFAAAHGNKTFAQFYGTFGACVSSKTQSSSEPANPNAPVTPGPGQTCKAELQKMGKDVFGSTYGTNANHRNAFGKCVSKVAQAQEDAEQNAASACRKEQADTGFAAAHGKTFDQLYGTNAGLTNAFGKCVSQKASAAAAAAEKATISAAKACQTERGAGLAAFKQKYGTFGHCVSTKAHGH
jgi:hypothetical protein